MRGAYGHGLPSTCGSQCTIARPSLMKGIGVKEAGSGMRHDVGVLGLLAHGADGVAGEADALGCEQLDGLDRHQLGARLAAQVDEQREDELGARVPCECPRVRWVAMTRPCLLLGIKVSHEETRHCSARKPRPARGEARRSGLIAFSRAPSGDWSSYAASRCNLASMPVSSSSGATRMPIVFLMAKAMMNATTNEYDHHGTRGDRLPPQLVEAAAVEQAVDLVRHAVAGEEADQQGADDAADEVDADDVERVVVAELLLQARPRTGRSHRRSGRG